MRDDAASVVKLHILVPKLDGPAVGRCLCILTGPQAREEANLDEVSEVLGEEGFISCFCSFDNKTKGNYFFALGRGILIGIMTKLPG